MKEMSQGNTYRCKNDACGVEVEVRQNCRCEDECHLTCCGQKMELKA